MKVVGILAVIAALFMTACVSYGRPSAVIVSGVGTVFAQPDTVQIGISLGKTAPTIREAHQEVSTMVRQALRILYDAGIEDQNISTAALRFSPEHDWGPAGRILLGQRAEQAITFSVGNINVMGERVTDIIDQLVQIDGITLHQMAFSIEDNTELFARSRELAYEKALEKAEQFAALAGKRIVRAVSISEEGVMPITPFLNRAFNTQMAFAADSGAALGSAILPTGELEITSRIVVEFLLR